MEIQGRISDFEQVMLPHLDAAYNLARWLVRDPSIAEDVVQDAYERASYPMPTVYVETSRRYVRPSLASGNQYKRNKFRSR